MKVYQLIVNTNVLDASYLFEHPPVRKDIVKLLGDIWGRLQPDTRECSWELMILAHASPEVPWIGVFETLFSKLRVIEHGVIDNV